MGNCYSRLQQLGVFDGNERHGLVLGNRLISYHQVEMALLEYPNIMEAGIIAQYLKEGHQALTVFLALEENIEDVAEKRHFAENITKFIQEKFDLNIPTTVKIYRKLPVTRTGKILRSTLARWMEEEQQAAAY